MTTVQYLYAKFINKDWVTYTVGQGGVQSIELSPEGTAAQVVYSDRPEKIVINLRHAYWVEYR